MANYAKLMEILADALPVTVKSNESTGTCAYYTGNRTLYITHQGNKNYIELLVARPENAVQNPMKGLNKTLRKNVNEPLEDWLRSVKIPQKDSWARVFQKFEAELAAVKVVLNQDLFLTTGIGTSGLHGESRIIRFLAIKFLRLQSADLLSQAFSEKNRLELERRFKEHFANTLFFGSSQGACGYCGAYMKRLGISWKTKQGINKNRSGTWLNPFSMTTAESTFQHSVRTVYAPRVAERQVEWKMERMENAAPQILLDIWAEQNAWREAEQGVMDIDS